MPGASEVTLKTTGIPALYQIITKYGKRELYTYV